MVRLAASDPRWPELFRVEAARIVAAMARAGLAVPALEHIGSTAVPGLVAKPILDMMLGVAPGAPLTLHVAACVDLGYQARGPQGVAGRELLVLGPETSRTHHL